MIVDSLEWWTNSYLRAIFKRVSKDSHTRFRSGEDVERSLFYRRLRDAES